RVAVTVFVGQRQQDVERRRRQRQKSVDFLRDIWHARTIATVDTLSMAIDGGRERMVYRRSDHQTQHVPALRSPACCRPRLRVPESQGRNPAAAGSNASVGYGSSGQPMARQDTPGTETDSDFGLLIDGQLVAGTDMLDVINPATGQVFARCPAAG